MKEWRWFRSRAEESWASLVAQPAVQEMWAQPVVWKDPLEEACPPTQYPCLENPTDTGAWWATVHGVAESWTRLKQLSVHRLI